MVEATPYQSPGTIGKRGLDAWRAVTVRNPRGGAGPLSGLEMHPDVRKSSRADLPVECRTRVVRKVGGNHYLRQVRQTLDVLSQGASFDHCLMVGNHSAVKSVVTINHRLDVVQQKSWSDRQCRSVAAAVSGYLSGEITRTARSEKLCVFVSHNRRRRSGAEQACVRGNPRWGWQTCWGAGRPTEISGVRGVHESCKAASVRKTRLVVGR